MLAIRDGRVCPAERNGEHRPAFTLLELILALAVMSMLAAVMLPPMTLLLSDRRMARSADLMQIELGKARLDAMRDGTVLVLRGELGGSTLTVAPYFSASDATETGSPIAQSALATGARQASVIATDQNARAARSIALPENITLTSIVVANSARSMMDQSDPTGGGSMNPAAMPAVGEGGVDLAAADSASIFFYPDGSTSDAAIIMGGADQLATMVLIRGVTGQTSIVEINTP